MLPSTQKQVVREKKKVTSKVTLCTYVVQNYRFLLVLLYKQKSFYLKESKIINNVVFTFLFYCSIIRNIKWLQKVV